MSKPTYEELEADYKAKALELTMAYNLLGETETKLSHTEAQVGVLREALEKVIPQLKLMTSRASLAGSPINDKLDLMIANELAESHKIIAQASAALGKGEK